VALRSVSPGTGNWEIKGGDVTVARFDGMGGEYSLFMGHAKGTTGPFTLGTYLWIEVPDWPLWEEKFIYGPYIHHVVGIHDLASYALYEATRFIPGLKPDPANPTEEEIRKIDCFFLIFIFSAECVIVFSTVAVHQNCQTFF